MSALVIAALIYAGIRFFTDIILLWNKLIHIDWQRVFDAPRSYGGRRGL